MGLTHLLPTHSGLKPLLRKLKVYPRLRLHISFADLAASLCSFLYFSDDSQHIREIQSFWKTNKEVLVTLSVRTSLDLLLQSLNLPPGSEVLMSAVNIRDMVEIVQRHKLVPVSVDISLDTLAPKLDFLENLITEKTKIFIVAHLFGSIINLDPYSELCKKHNILLFEDCAQAFAGDKYYGHDGADISLFSFGPIKSCTALGGAVAIIQDKTLASKIKNIEYDYPQRSEFWFLQRLLKYYCLKLLSIPVLYCNVLAVLKALGKDVDSAINSMTRGFSKGDILDKIRYRPPKRMLALLNRRLSNYHNDWVEKRQSNARKFISLLLPEIVCLGSSAEYNSFWLVAILVSDPEFMMTKLRENGFDATRGSTSLTFIDASQFENKHQNLINMNSERLIKYVLYLPVSESLPKNEITYLAGLVNKYYCECSTANDAKKLYAR